MLNYHPDKRISAQELLANKWLNMPANFDYTMSEKEYQRSVIIKQNKKPEKGVGGGLEDEIKLDVFESDNELNKADEEDNDHGYMSDESDGFNGLLHVHGQQNADHRLRFFQAAQSPTGRDGREGRNAGNLLNRAAPAVAEGPEKPLRQLRAPEAGGMCLAPPTPDVNRGHEQESWERWHPCRPARG